jgi:hypothetical protein
MARDLTLTPEARATFLAGERILRLATVDDEGWPTIVPLWFVHHPHPSGELWIWNLDRARRTGRLLEGGRCGVSLDGGRDYAELHGIAARAVPTRIAADDVPLEVRSAYAHKYFASDEPLAHADHHTWFALALVAERSWDFRQIAQ